MFRRIVGNHPRTVAERRAFAALVGAASGPVFRRLILPALCAIGLICAIELAIQLRYHPGFWQKTTWLMHDPYKGELFDRSELYLRLSHLEDSDPDIISVGDSSGFFSLQSTIVNRFIPGYRFLNLNTGANQAFIGYQAIAEYMLRRTKHIKYVVLYVFPQLLPQEEVIRVADLGPITENDLVSVRSYVTPPSAFLSPYAKALLFNGRHFHVAGPPSSHMPTLQLWSTVDAALGWLPEFDVRYDRVDGRSPFYSDARSGWYNRLGLTEPSAINANLSDFEKMVRSYGAKLVIAFGPISRRGLVPGDPNVPVADAALARFQREHPEVKFLFPLITRWGEEKFGMSNHISREYTFLGSERVGKGLAALLRDADSIPPFTGQFGDSGPYPAIVAKPLGPPDPTLLKPALALYLHASTGDAASAELLSRRVADLLADQPAYRDMMADTRARTASLAERGIEIGFDLSQLRAVPVEISGLSHCAERPGVEWVQLEGSMIFTYDSPDAHVREPVRWPHESHIFIPTIVEEGVRRFDGYCPEPSLEAAARAAR
jgi:hypothetical protein